MNRGLMMVMAAMLVGGCASKPPMRLYVLGDPTWRSEDVRPGTGLSSIELRTVSIPDYLDTTDILRRVGTNEVVPSPTGRWGERLSLGLTDALASALSRRLPGSVIATRAPVQPLWRIVIHVEALDMDAGGQCRVVAGWRITGGDGAAASKTGRGTFTETAAALDDAAMAAAMTRVVDQLAERIVAALERE